MASSMLYSCSTTTVTRNTPAQASMVAPFTGLKSTAAFPATRKAADITTVANNGGRVSCMKRTTLGPRDPLSSLPVGCRSPSTCRTLIDRNPPWEWGISGWGVYSVWPTEGLKKFETLSYLPPLTEEQLLRQIEYLLKLKLVPCLEFEKTRPFIERENNRSPGYYDGRYWTMWKLPMFGCTDAVQVVKEIQEVSKEKPEAYVRVIGFDPFRQVQCISFIAHKPPGADP